MIDYKIPFYENTDDTHCYQACLKMVLKYFEPDQDYSFEQLDKLTAKEDSKPTWPMAGLCWLSDKNYEIVEIEDFDYLRFLKEGMNYIRQEFGDDVAQYSSQSDEQMVNKWTKEFIKKCQPINRVPTVTDIRELLDKGFLVIAHVNWKKLHNKKGYIGHKILVRGCDEKSLIIHDPGLPGQKNLHLADDKFEHIWSEAREITAIKLTK